jgi:hypothetical protein
MLHGRIEGIQLVEVVTSLTSDLFPSACASVPVGGDLFARYVVRAKTINGAVASATRISEEL